MDQLKRSGDECVVPNDDLIKLRDYSRSPSHENFLNAVHPMDRVTFGLSLAEVARLRSDEKHFRVGCCILNMENRSVCQFAVLLPAND